MTGHRVPSAFCPRCNMAWDGAFSPDSDEPPSPNDIAICTGCGSINIYDKDLRLLPCDVNKLYYPDRELALRMQAVVLLSLPPHGEE